MHLPGHLLVAIKSALNSERIVWTERKGWLVENGASGKVSVVVERDEIGLVAVENLHGGGSAAVIVSVCYRDFHMALVWAKCARSVIAVTNLVSAKLYHHMAEEVFISNCLFPAIKDLKFRELITKGVSISTGCSYGSILELCK